MVYVLPHRAEEFLKLGFSRDPLQRMQNLHRRYFDFFDFDRALFIETESVRDARRVEKELKRALIEHRSPAPLDVRHEARGETEWYRGAYATLRAAVENYARSGFTVHRDVRGWLRHRLRERAPLLFEWSSQQLALIAMEGGSEAKSPRVQTVIDALDACVALELDITDLVPGDVLLWYRTHRRE